ncbi:hemolysin-type calcium-binding region [Nostoc commune NIES-4072]|uniref:Hemolysin-type calcium-binding region n=1 Tax=Nostoc commune NIES-4072 TaxID=2005467 RepID=A0A2R5FLL0_NOSCO|nr:hemolysin-type calcium-binding region [Nostoc commune HK-02]GBG16681.1 hemolysin-type calcium-binding region [Nostoc commune NIES-4072]
MQVLQKANTLIFETNNFLSGTTSDDQISGFGNDDNIFAGLGNDVIDGEEGNVIEGGLGDDTLIGGAGDDIFKGSQGNDSINGGDGIDTADYSELGTGITLSGVGTITKADGFGTDQIFKIETVIADPSVANNTIDASESLAGVSITADLEAGSISANNVPELETLTFNVLNFVNVIGTNESDIITGDDQNNQLFGNDGDDSIIGGQNNDILTGGFGADKFIFNNVNEGLDIIKDYNFAESVAFKLETLLEQLLPLVKRLVIMLQKWRFVHLAVSTFLLKTD